MLNSQRTLHTVQTDYKKKNYYFWVKPSKQPNVSLKLNLDSDSQNLQSYITADVTFPWHCTLHKYICVWLPVCVNYVMLYSGCPMLLKADYLALVLFFTVNTVRVKCSPLNYGMFNINLLECCSDNIFVRLLIITLRITIITFSKLVDESTIISGH